MHTQTTIPPCKWCSKSALAIHLNTYPDLLAYLHLQANDKIFSSLVIEDIYQISIRQQCKMLEELLFSHRVPLWPSQCNPKLWEKTDPPSSNVTLNSFSRMPTISTLWSSLCCCWLNLLEKNMGLRTWWWSQRHKAYIQTLILYKAMTIPVFGTRSWWLYRFCANTIYIWTLNYPAVFLILTSSNTSDLLVLISCCKCWEISW